MKNRILSNCVTIYLKLSYVAFERDGIHGLSLHEKSKECNAMGKDFIISFVYTLLPSPEATVLTRNKVDLAQGNFYARPARFYEEIAT
jgi:hypothetical protein